MATSSTGDFKGWHLILAFILHLRINKLWRSEVCVKVCDHYGKRTMERLTFSKSVQGAWDCGPLQFLVFGLALYWRGRGGQEEGQKPYSGRPTPDSPYLTSENAVSLFNNLWSLGGFSSACSFFFSTLALQIQISLWQVTKCIATSLSSSVMGAL